MMEESSCGTYRQGARCVEPPLLSTVESEPWRFCVLQSIFHIRGRVDRERVGIR